MDFCWLWGREIGPRAGGRRRGLEGAVGAEAAVDLVYTVGAGHVPGGCRTLPGGSQRSEAEFAVFSGPTLNAAKFANVCCALVAVQRERTQNLYWLR